MRKKVYVIGMIVLVLIVIAEGFVIYNLYAFIKKEENMYAHYEKEYIKRLSDELKLERKGLRHDTRGGDFCPACDSKDVAEIRYGLYDSKNDVWKEEIESGKVALIRKEMHDRYKANKDRQKIAEVFNNSTKSDQQWLQSQIRKEKYGESKQMHWKDKCHSK